jgi:hypothetical protein
MSRKSLITVLGLCLAVAWVSEGFTHQSYASKKAQETQTFEASLYFEEDGQIYTVIESGKAKLKKGKLRISYELLIDNDVNELTKVTEIIIKVNPSAELPFNQIIVTMPYLDGYARQRLIKEFMAAMDDDEIEGAKPNGWVDIRDSQGVDLSTWNILAWHIESFDFPTLDSKDETQLHQSMTIRAEKFLKEDDEDNED